jgi:hypothetical protein
MFGIFKPKVIDPYDALIKQLKTPCREVYFGLFTPSKLNTEIKTVFTSLERISTDLPYYTQLIITGHVETLVILKLNLVSLPVKRIINHHENISQEEYVDLLNLLSEYLTAIRNINILTEKTIRQNRTITTARSITESVVNLATVLTN